MCLCGPSVRASHQPGAAVQLCFPRAVRNITEQWDVYLDDVPDVHSWGVYFDDVPDDAAAVLS